MDVKQNLSLEIVTIISEFLAGDNAFETLACVNVLSKAIHKATLPILYFAVIWENDDHWNYSDLAKGDEGSASFMPSGWQYTRILFVDGVSAESLLEHVAEISPDPEHLALFPNLQLLVTKEYGDEPDGWPVPLRTCTIDVFQPVAEIIFTSIQEYPLWWPEHDGHCECLIDDGLLPGSSPITLDTLSSGCPESCDCSNSSRSGSSASMECVVGCGDSSVRSGNPRCTCLRLPFDYVGQIFFLPDGHITPSQFPRSSSMRQLHPDVRVFAAWKKTDRISDTLLCVFRLFDFMNHLDIDPWRNGCDVHIRMPCIALVPFANVLPQILAGNSDLLVLLDILDRPPRRNACFTDIMQRVLNSYLLALPHLVACRSRKRRFRTILTVVFPAHRDCRKKRRPELESEISWNDGTSLNLLTISSRPPRFRKEVITKYIGAKNHGTGLFPIEEEED